MITINLRPGQKRKTAGSPMQGVQEGFKKVSASVKNPLLGLALAAWVAVVGGVGYLFSQTTSELAAVEPKLEQTRGEFKRFQGFLQQKKKQELIRDSLKAQIETIRGVDGDRYVWPHILDEVSRSLPAYTWLTDIVGARAAVDTTAVHDPKDPAPKPSVNVTISGRTVDIQAYTKFLRDLENSPWIVNVTPLQAQTVIENDRAVTQFSVRASYTLADSAYIRTVPLSQSVR